MTPSTIIPSTREHWVRLDDVDAFRDFLERRGVGTVAFAASRLGSGKLGMRAGTLLAQWRDPTATGGKAVDVSEFVPGIKPIWQRPPAGYRALTAEEGDKLSYRTPVLLSDGRDLFHGTVRGVTDSEIRVVLDYSGHVVGLDRDDPNFWPDGETRDRRPPNSGEFVAVAVNL